MENGDGMGEKGRVRVMGCSGKLIVRHFPIAPLLPEIAHIGATLEGVASGRRAAEGYFFASSPGSGTGMPLT